MPADPSADAAHRPTTSWPDVEDWRCGVGADRLARRALQGGGVWDRRGAAACVLRAGAAGGWGGGEGVVLCQPLGKRPGGAGQRRLRDADRGGGTDAVCGAERGAGGSGTAGLLLLGAERLLDDGFRARPAACGGGVPDAGRCGDLVGESDRGRREVRGVGRRLILQLVARRVDSAGGAALAWGGGGDGDEPYRAVGGVGWGAGGVVGAGE